MSTVMPPSDLAHLRENHMGTDGATGVQSTTAAFPRPCPANIRGMISPSEAWQRIEERLKISEMERIPRSEAPRRVLAKDLDATLDVPPNDVSAMDGFAIGANAGTGSQIPTPLAIAAGDPPGAVLEPGTAARIMTGAPVPENTDRIVPIEQTEPGEGSVVLLELGTTGQHVRRKGEVARVGQPLLQAGHKITPGTLSQLATHGLTDIPVFGRPRVAFLTTGSEIVAPEEAPGAGQIRDSHSDFFRAALGQLGIEAETLGIAADQPDLLRQKIEQGLERDVLILSGGVSMGEFDLVEGVLGELGGEVLFDSVAIQPGKPMVTARHEQGRGGWIFALPGNPASAMVTYWLLVRPALRRMMGHHDHYWHGALEAELSGPLPRAKGRDLFLPSRVRFENGSLLAEPVAPIGSHDVAAYAHGSALVKVPARQEARAKGSCEILPLIEWPGDQEID